MPGSDGTAKGKHAGVLGQAWALKRGLRLCMGPVRRAQVVQVDKPYKGSDKKWEVPKEDNNYHRCSAAPGLAPGSSMTVSPRAALRGVGDEPAQEPDGQGLPQHAQAAQRRAARGALLHGARARLSWPGGKPGMPPASCTAGCSPVCK